MLYEYVEHVLYHRVVEHVECADGLNPATEEKTEFLDGIESIVMCGRFGLNTSQTACIQV
jgi:hypothetical protein